MAAAEVSVQQAGDITRAGPQAARHRAHVARQDHVTLTREGEKVVLRGGRSRFTLSSLPASEFPVIEEINAQHSLRIPAQRLPPADRQDALCDGAAGRALLPQWHAARDRRQGAARGSHRWPSPVLVRAAARRASARELQQIILPRKGVLELQRLLDGEGEIEVAIGTNHIRVQIGEVRLTSKLIDGKFPEYSRVIPTRAAARHDRATGGAARGACSARRSFPTRSTAVCGSPSPPGLLTVQAHNPGAGGSRGSARGRASAARDSRSASTSATCWMRWPPSRRRPSRSASPMPNSSCLIRAPGDARSSTSSCRCGSRPSQCLAEPRRAAAARICAA